MQKKILSLNSADKAIYMSYNSIYCTPNLCFIPTFVSSINGCPLQGEGLPNQKQVLCVQRLYTQTVGQTRIQRGCYIQMEVEQIQCVLQEVRGHHLKDKRVLDPHHLGGDLPSTLA